MLSKNYALVCKWLIHFSEAFIPYNELQFFDWPSIVVHSPVGLMYIVYGLVILVHGNIQVTTITIIYIQLREGFECWIRISVSLFTVSFVCKVTRTSYSHKH